MLKNDTLMRAIRRQHTEYTPLWLMRQAGRYLPEYCETRKKAGSFLKLCKSPELACEVTLQPLERYDLDAAILFSDILTIPDAMGLELYFSEGEGPKFRRPLRTESEILALEVPDLSQLNYVFDAVSTIRKALNNKLPLIGFSGSPFTLACYMIEGEGSRDFRHAKSMLYSRPELFHHILQVNADAISLYLSAQIERGVDVVMLFDTWGGLLSHPAYETFSLQYLQYIIKQLRQLKNGADTPIIVFTKGGGLWLEKIAAIGCDAVGLDWSVDIGDAKRRIGSKVALQGNLDPNILFASPEVITREAKLILERFGSSENSGHIFNLGHGISQFTPPEHVHALIETVHNHSRKMRVDMS